VRSQAEPGNEDIGQVSQQSHLFHLVPKLCLGMRCPHSSRSQAPPGNALPPRLRLALGRAWC